MKSHKNLDAEEIGGRLAPVIARHFENPPHFNLFTTLRFHPGLYPMDSPVPMLDAIDAIPLPQCMFFLLQYHLEKLQRSAKYFDFPSGSLSMENIILGLTECLQDKDRLISYRIRVVLNKYGDLTFTPAELPVDNHLVTCVPQTNFDLQNVGPIRGIENGVNLTLAPNMLPLSTDPLTEPWIIHVSPEAVIPNQFTSFKTTNRELHNHHRGLLGLPLPGHAPDAPSAYSNPQDVLLYTNTHHVLETTIASIAVHRLIIHPTNGTRQWGWLTPPLSSGCQDAAVRRWLLDSGAVEESMIDVRSLKEGEIIMVFNAVSGIRLGQIKLHTP